MTMNEKVQRIQIQLGEAETSKRISARSAVISVLLFATVFVSVFCVWAQQTYELAHPVLH
jgi:hypothetical protein